MVNIHLEKLVDITLDVSSSDVVDVRETFLLMLGHSDREPERL